MFAFGYLGIFLLMTLESTFFPFPSEAVLIPSGYLAYKGLMNVYLIIFFGVLGGITGAYINYYIAEKVGRDFLHKHAKWFFTTKERLIKMEDLFRKYGGVSTFFGRLLPLVRQYISFPAGLSKMKLKKFFFYTFIGSLIWSTFLTYLGYSIGKNMVLIERYINLFVFIVIVIIFIVILYFYFSKNKGDIFGKDKIKRNS